VGRKRENEMEGDKYGNDGYLLNGYDYVNQAWVKKGRYVRCDHPPNMGCHCYGKLHEDERNIVKQSENE
jgi:hypothetical protein